MSDIAEMLARISSMKESSGGGGGSERGFSAAESAGGFIDNLTLFSPEGGPNFGMSDSFQNLSQILSPSASFDDLFKISSNPNTGYVTFDLLEKFLPQIKSKLATMPQQGFFAANIKPPHMPVGGIKTAFGKSEGQG